MSGFSESAYDLALDNILQEASQLLQIQDAMYESTNSLSRRYPSGTPDAARSTGSEGCQVSAQVKTDAEKEVQCEFVEEQPGITELKLMHVEECSDEQLYDHVDTSKLDVRG